MAPYRKIPRVVEAWQWTPPEITPGPVPEWLMKAADIGKVRHNLVAKSIEISTLEGVMTAKVNDWIIQGVQGEIYPCKPDIFAATYEAVIYDGEVIATAEPPRPSTPTREAIAEAIYNKMPFVGVGHKPPWTPEGNSKKQDEARLYADAVLEPLVPLAQLPDGPMPDTSDIPETSESWFKRAEFKNITPDKLIAYFDALRDDLRVERLHVDALAAENEKLATENARLRAELVLLKRPPLPANPVDPADPNHEARN
jgi:hypothetical protein